MFIKAAIAWLIQIDAQVYCTYVLKTHDVTWLNWIPCMIAFVGWVLLTITPVQNLILETDDEHDAKVANFARGWVFAAILILFTSGVVGFILTLVDLAKYQKEYVWGALVSLFHPMLVIISAFGIFFGRIYGDQVKFGEDPNDYGFM